MEIHHARLAALAQAAEQLAAGEPPEKVARQEFVIVGFEQQQALALLEANGFHVNVVPYADLAIAMRLREIKLQGEDAIVLSGDRDFAIFGCLLQIKDIRLGADGQLEVLPADVPGFLKAFGATGREHALLLVSLLGSDGTGPGDRLGIQRARVHQLVALAGGSAGKLLELVALELPGVDVAASMGRAVCPYLGGGIFGKLEDELLSLLGDQARPPAAPRKRNVPSASVWHQNPAVAYAAPFKGEHVTGGPTTIGSKMVRYIYFF